jgi:hypothetical protein
MSAKIWVVSRYGWEYDDSRYYRPESDGTTPVAACTFAEMAHNICKERNIRELRDLGSCGLKDYISSYDIDLDDNESQEFLKSHFLDDDLDFTLSPREIPEDILLEVMERFSLNFYEVIEVELLA